MGDVKRHASRLLPWWQGVVADSPAKLWGAAFVYVLFMGVLTQFLLLPYVFPLLHAGSGLLAIGDSESYHRIAGGLAESIRSEGWAAWRLRPGGQAPSGMMAILYVLFGTHPYLVLPLNAACHATALVILMAMLRCFVSPAVSSQGILPFLLFPSSLLWLSQPNKDSMYVAGCYLFLLGFIVASRLDSWRSHWLRLVGMALLISSGMVLVWLVRPYGVRILQIVAGGMIVLLLGRDMVCRNLSSMRVFALIFAVLLLMAVPRGVSLGEMYLENAAVSKYPPVVQAPLPPPAEEMTVLPKFEGCRVPGWQALLPHTIDMQICELVLSRRDYYTTYASAGSNVDADWSMKSALDVLSYAPRAIQLVLFSPFPQSWLTDGKSVGGLGIRIVYSLETVISYFALIGVVSAIWGWRRHLEMWLVLIFSLGMLIPLSLAVPNIGTLYRMRFGFYMLVICLGLSALLEAFVGWKDMNKHGREAK